MIEYNKKTHEIMAQLPKRYKDAQQGIETFNLGDMIRVDNDGEKEFFLNYPNGSTAPCRSGYLSKGLYYLDYVFEDGDAVYLDTGIPDIMFKTRHQYIADAVKRENYLQKQVSSTMHIVNIISSCIMITYAVCYN